MRRLVTPVTGPGLANGFWRRAVETVGRGGRHSSRRMSRSPRAWPTSSKSRPSLPPADLLVAAGKADRPVNIKKVPNDVAGTRCAGRRREIRAGEPRNRRHRAGDVFSVLETWSSTCAVSALRAACNAARDLRRDHSVQQPRTGQGRLERGDRGSFRRCCMPLPPRCRWTFSSRRTPIPPDAPSTAKHGAPRPAGGHRVGWR